MSDVVRRITVDHFAIRVADLERSRAFYRAALAPLGFREIVVDSYSAFGAPTVQDAAIRNDSLFGGIAWHGYSGDVSMQTTVHNQFPSVDAFETEHSGGTWIAARARS